MEQSTTSTMSKHAIFCDKVGIKKSQPTTTGTMSRHTIFCCKVASRKPVYDPEANYQTEPVDGGFYKKVLKAYKRETLRYQFIVTIIHILQLLQIIFGATATAISASKVPTIAVTVLTAIVTVVAGILAFIRGHLDSTRQLQNNLRKVRDYIRFKEMQYREPALCDATVEVAMEEEAMEKEVKDPMVKVKDVTAEVGKAMAEVKKAIEEAEKLYYNAVVGNKSDKTKSPGA